MKNQHVYTTEDGRQLITKIEIAEFSGFKFGHYGLVLGGELVHEIKLKAGQNQSIARVLRMMADKVEDLGHD